MKAVARIHVVVRVGTSAGKSRLVFESFGHMPSHTPRC